MKSVKQGLIETLSIVEQGWTQGALARDKNGRAETLYSLHACEWCLMGAIDKMRRHVDDWEYAAKRTTYQHAIIKALRRVNPKLQNPDCVARWNDDGTRKKEDVIVLLSKAIELCDE